MSQNVDVLIQGGARLAARGLARPHAAPELGMLA